MAECICGARKEFGPGDSGPIAWLLDHRETWFHGFKPVGRFYSNVPDGHGRISTYSNLHWRCRDCLDAWATYYRLHRQRRKALRNETIRLLQPASSPGPVNVAVTSDGAQERNTA